MTKKKKTVTKASENRKDFITMLFPNIMVLIFVVFCLVADSAPKSMSYELFSLWGELLVDPIGIIVCILFFPVAIVLFLLFCVAAFFANPFYLAFDTFFLVDFIVWLTIVSGVHAIWGVFRIGGSKWAEDNSYVSGTHLEITIDSDGKVTAKEVNDYAGDSGIFKNVCLFVIRYIAIMGGGIFFFLHRVNRRAKR